VHYLLDKISIDSYEYTLYQIWDSHSSGYGDLYFWDIISCSPLEVNWRFGEIFKAGPLLAIYFYSSLFIGLIIDLEDGSEMFLREVGGYSTEYTILCPKRYNFWMYVVNYFLFDDFLSSALLV
jgi:hypothetical protein